MDDCKRLKSKDDQRRQEKQVQFCMPLSSLRLLTSPAAMPSFQYLQSCCHSNECISEWQEYFLVLLASLTSDIKGGAR